MDNYILRIYKKEADNSNMLVGVVEEVGVEGKKAFTSFDELWEILKPYQKTLSKGKPVVSLEGRKIRGKKKEAGKNLKNRHKKA